MKLFATFAALMLLLALTYFIARIDLGGLNVPIALLISSIKAVLVALIFMNLGSVPFNRLLAVSAGVIWLGILFAFSIADYLSRDWFLLPGRWPQ